MRVMRHWEKIPNAMQFHAHGTVVLIGTFDGLHIGHQALIKLAKQQALALNLPLVLLTFEPSPKNYFANQDKNQNKSQCIKLLGFYDRYQLLAIMGVDILVMVKFNHNIIRLSPEAFLDKLRLHINPKVYCLGQDFRFGINRTGDINTIQHYAKQYNQMVKILPTVDYMPISQENLIRASSTVLRACLAEGDLWSVRQLLNRPYTLSGKVSPGKKLGRTIGVRTANIYLKHCPIPLRGVYAVWVINIDSETVRYAGVANIGVRPTVHQDNQLILEVHLFDLLDQDVALYGKRIEVEFVQKIRDEKKFANLDALKTQIEKDSLQARLIVNVKQDKIEYNDEQ